MNNAPKDFSHIKGWGIDADPKNDPTYPMRQRSTEQHEGYGDWQRPSLQPATEEILHSNERPNLSAVFGTTSPPRGLSGLIRRFAFNYSENQYRHWLPLVMADKVDAIEGVFEDLAHGHIPNFLAEKGYKGKWKHDQKGVIGRLAVVTLVTAGAILWLTSDGKKKKPKIKRYQL